VLVREVLLLLQVVVGELHRSEWTVDLWRRMTSQHPQCQIRRGRLGATLSLIIGIRNRHLAIPHSYLLSQHNVVQWTRQRSVRHESRLLGVVDPRAAGAETNLGVMLHQLEVVITAGRRDHELTLGGHHAQSEDPHSGTCRCD
jgi:hypothetical protein